MKVVIFFCFIFLSCTSWGNTDFSRKEYFVPFRIDSDTVIPISATFSCMTAELDRKFTDINRSDPTYVQLANKVHGAIRSSDHEALIEMALPQPNISNKIEEDLKLIERFNIGGYQQYSDKEISVRAIVEVVDVHYVYCLAKNKPDESSSFVYAFRRGKNKQWYWDPLDTFNFGDIQNALYAKFSRIKGFSGMPPKTFTRQELLTDNGFNGNYVSLNYSMISLADGVPVSNKAVADVVNNLHSYWQAVLLSEIDNLTEFFDQKSFATLQKEDSKVGFVGATGALSKTINDNFRLTHIIHADPVVFVAYLNGDAFSSAVFVKDEGDLKRIRYHSYGGTREIFEGVLSRDSKKTITRWIH